MIRYRPPAPKKSPYITRQGMDRLQAEEKAIWPHRREVVAALSAAAAEGDRSENAEYIYRKKELREIDRRIRYLQKRLPDLTVVDQKPADVNRVYFGANVELEDDQDNVSVYRIVGPDEFDQDERYISVDSPLAQALLKKEVGDEVLVETPVGKTHYYLTRVIY